MRIPSVPTRRVWPLAVPAALILYLLGPQLAGLRSFAPTNMLYMFDPWKWFAPADTGIKTAGHFSDNWDALIPWHVQNASRLLHGDLPLWSPYGTGGADLLPNLGSMTLAPSTLIWMMLPDWYAGGLIKVLEIFGAWGFIYLLARRMGGSRAPAAVAGLAFATTGFQVTWFSWPHTLVNMLVAGTLWAWDRVRESPTDPLRIAVAAGFTAATILEGFPAVAFVGLIVAGMLVAVRVLTDWPGWAGSARAAGAVVLSAVLGLGLSMVSFLPFANLLSVYQLRRENLAPFPAQAMLSTVFSPNSWGSAEDYFGTASNFIEVQGYLAPAGLILMVAGLVVGIAARRRVAVMLFVLALGTVLYLYSFGVEPIYSLLKPLPVLSTNGASRVKATGAILLCLAIGLGLEALLRGGAARTSRILALALTAAASLGIVLGLSAVARRAPAEQAQFVQGEVTRAIVVIGLAVALAAVLLLRREPTTRVRHTAVAAVLLLVFVDAVVWIHPYWPSSRAEDFYPVTPPHAYLQAHLGQERMSSSDYSFWAGTGAAYGIRTMEGHGFTRPSWKEAIQAAGGRMVTQTYSRFFEESASSPVLDRFAVLYWGDAPGVRRCTGNPPRSGPVVTLAPGQEVAAGVGGRARGVSLRLAAKMPAEAEIVISSGESRGVARIRKGAKPGRRVYIPVAELAGDAASDAARAYRIESVSGGPVQVFAGDDGPLVACTQQEDDGLQLEFTEGAMLYRRLHALPRIRWASGSAVQVDPQARLALLASGTLPADQVLLGSGAAQPPTGSGRLTDLLDDADQTRVTTQATASGWLVIADPKQSDWQATIDGAPASVVPADHAGIAVAVPAGTHTVEVRATPAGLRTGALVSLASLLCVLALAVLGLLRRRRHDPPGSFQEEMHPGQDFGRSMDPAPTPVRIEDRPPE